MLQATCSTVCVTTRPPPQPKSDCSPTADLIFKPSSAFTSRLIPPSPPRSKFLGFVCLKPLLNLTSIKIFFLSFFAMQYLWQLEHGFQDLCKTFSTLDFIWNLFCRLGKHLKRNIIPSTKLDVD